MIGDANGHTEEETVTSINNPFLKPLTQALDKLKKIDGHWGIILDKKNYDTNKINNNINEFEYDLLILLSKYNIDEETANIFLKKYGYDESEENHDYMLDFSGLLISVTSYSFLIYKGYKLK